MIVYLDTSSMVKLYVEEAGSAQARDLVAAARVVATSRLAVVEAVAAFSRRLAARGATPEYRRARADLGRDWADYLVIEVTPEVCDIAVSFADKHRLRGFDALHLATAVVLRQRIQESVIFSSADKELNKAAALEGMGMA